MSEQTERVGMDLVWHWLGRMPLPVLTVLFITACMTFAGWMWNTEATVGNVRSAVAVQAEKVATMKDVAQEAADRLAAIDSKLDDLKKQITDYRLEAMRSRYSRNYPAASFDAQPQPAVSPSPSPRNPLLNRENR